MLEATHPPVVMRPVAYSFRFKEMGWAIFTLNDTTGEFSIQSDWGNYSYRWHVNALGEGYTLHSFLTKCDADYIANKFKRDGLLKDEIDIEATEKAFHDHICQERRARNIKTKAEARGLWLEVDEWAEAGFVDMCFTDSLSDFFDYHHDFIRHERSTRYKFLVTELLPFFQRYLRENAQLSLESAPTISL
jgi:hypothetical protein